MSNVKISEQQKEWAIKISPGIVVLVLCYAVMVSPVFRDIAFLQQSIGSSQKRIELYQDVRNLGKSLESSESLLATLAERSQLLGKIADIAGGKNIRVQTLTPKTEPEGGYVKLTIDMDGQGSFLTLIKFLQSVEKIGAAIKIRDVTMLWRPSTDLKDKPYPLQLSLVFETFLKQRVKKNV